MKRLIIIFIVFMPNVLFAQDELNSYLQRHIQKEEYKLEKEWKKDLFESLTKISSAATVDVNVTINKNQILTHPNVSEIFENDKTPSLPALPSTSLNVSKQRLSVVLSTDFLREYISQVEVTVRTAIEPFFKHQNELENFIKDQLPKSLSSKVRVSISKSNLMQAIEVNRKKELNSSSSDEQKTPEDENQKDVQEEPKQWWEKIPPELYIALGLISFFAFIFLWQLRKSSKMLAQALAQLGAQNAAAPGVGGGAGFNPQIPEQQKIGSASANGEHFIVVTQKIRGLLEQEDDLASQMLNHYLLGEQFSKVLVLLGALESSERAKILSEFPEELQSRFQEYVRHEAQLILDDESVLLSLAQSIYHSAWIAAQDRTSMLQMSLVKQFQTVGEEQYTKIIKGLPEDEQKIALSISPAELAAIGITHAQLSSDTISELTNVKIDTQGLSKLYKSVTSILHQESGTSASVKKIIEIGAYLSSEQEAALYQMAGIGDVKAFDALFNKYEDYVFKWANQLALEELGAFLTVSDQLIREKIISRLPEIKARRLNAAANYSPQVGKKLKAELTKQLRNEDQLASSSEEEVYREVS